MDTAGNKINQPELQVYVADFGKRDDNALLAIQDGKVSLSVQKANYAVKMYEAVGFRVLDEKEEEYIMVCDLDNMRFSSSKRLS